MRQRKVKNEEERLNEFGKNLIRNPRDHKGRWQELFGNQNDIYIEIGCGKGKFIITKAQENPDKNFIGIEGQGSVLLRALEKAEQVHLSNLIFLKEFMLDVEEYFAGSEISGIYLNFSDPWPKDRHAKRRLTHSRYLDGYKNILKPDHTIEFKTDNDELFQFALSEFKQNGLSLEEVTEDLHSSVFPAQLVTTEYEEKFKSANKTINYCKARMVGVK